MSESALVALGGNLGDVRATFRVALSELAATLGELRAVSSAYRTPALTLTPEEESPDYWNAVALFETELDARTVLKVLLDVERRHGRERSSSRWAPRTLDLDLIVLGDDVVDEAGLTLPHPEVTRRDFVLVPAAEIAPHFVVPGKGTFAQLLEACGGGFGSFERDLSLFFDATTV